MRTSLIIFGVIFLVIGGLLYFVPMQVFKADTTTVGTGGTDTRTSSASIDVPAGWAYASAIIGLVLLVFGLAIPNPRGKSKKGSYEKVVESKENTTKSGDGNTRKVVREQSEKQKIAN